MQKRLPDQNERDRAWSRGWKIMCKLCDQGYDYSIRDCRIGAMMYAKGVVNGIKTEQRRKKVTL